MGLTVITGGDDGDRAGLRRCTKCEEPMDFWSRTPEGDLCAADARLWILADRDRALSVLPHLWHLRDAIRTVKDSRLAAEVDNDQLLLTARLDHAFATELHVTVLPNEEGVLGYAYHWPGRTPSGTPMLRPLGDPTTDPRDAAREVAVQIVTEHDSNQPPNPAPARHGARPPRLVQP